MTPRILAVRSALGSGAFPIGHHQAEVIERHFRKAVDAGLIGSGFFAAVVDGKYFTSNRFGSGRVGDGLRLRTGRERKKTYS